METNGNQNALGWLKHLQDQEIRVVPKYKAVDVLVMKTISTDFGVLFQKSNADGFILERPVFRPFTRPLFEARFTSKQSKCVLTLENVNAFGGWHEVF